MNRLIAGIILLGLLGAAGWFWWTTTPQYAVKQAQEAVKAHDVQRFHNFVDVDNVSSSAIDDLLSGPLRASGSGLIERIVGFALVSFVKPAVVESMDKQIDLWVKHKKSSSGASNSQDDDDDADEPQPRDRLFREIMAMVKPPSLKRVFREYGLTKENYRGLGSTDAADHVAHVGLRFFSPHANREVEIKLELSKGSGHWRIMRLSNLAEVLPVLSGG